MFSSRYSNVFVLETFLNRDENVSYPLNNGLKTFYVLKTCLEHWTFITSYVANMELSTF